jgi:HNH endonuclease
MASAFLCDQPINDQVGTCLVCNGVVVKRHRNKLAPTCSRACGRVIAIPKAHATRSANVAIARQHVCQHCNAGFVRRSYGKAGENKYCSRQCLHNARRIYVDKRQAKKEGRLRRAALEAKVVHVCSVCGVDLVGQARLCEAHKKPAYVPVPPKTTRCIYCYAEITGRANLRRCKLCARKHSRSISKHRGRARHHGVAYEPINPLKVFDRDKWRCQMCLIKTPRKMRGTMNPNAPELDHRIPMAMGGAHLWDNVQCACRACNQLKGGRYAAGQMNLL